MSRTTCKPFTFTTEQRIEAVKAAVILNEIPAMMAENDFEEFIWFDFHKNVGPDTIVYANGKYMGEIWRIFRLFFASYFCEEPHFNINRIYSINIDRNTERIVVGVVKLTTHSGQEVFVDIYNPSREDKKLLKTHPIFGWYFGGAKFLRKTRHRITKDFNEYNDDMDRYIEKIYEDPYFSNEDWDEIDEIEGEKEAAARRICNFYKEVNSLLM